MAEPLTTRALRASAALLVARATLGAYFLLAGVTKIRGGWPGWLEYYSAQVPPFVPSWFSQPYGYALPVLEALVGALLIVGLFTRLTALATMLMLVSFTITLVYQKGSITGGGAGPFHSNIVFAALALVLAALGAGRWSLDAWRRGKRPERPTR